MLMKNILLARINEAMNKIIKIIFQLKKAKLKCIKHYRNLFNIFLIFSSFAEVVAYNVCDSIHKIHNFCRATVKKERRKQFS